MSCYQVFVRTCAVLSQKIPLVETRSAPALATTRLPPCPCPRPLQPRTAPTHPRSAVALTAYCRCTATLSNHLRRDRLTSRHPNLLQTSRSVVPGPAPLAEREKTDVRARYAFPPCGTAISSLARPPAPARTISDRHLVVAVN